VIRAIKRALAHHMPMIIGPAPDFGVEFVNQIGGRLTQRSFDHSVLSENLTKPTF
jgi:hypothetical protein